MMLHHPLSGLLIILSESASQRVLTINDTGKSVIRGYLNDCLVMYKYDNTNDGWTARNANLSIF